MSHPSAPVKLSERDGSMVVVCGGPQCVAVGPPAEQPSATPARAEHPAADTWQRWLALLAAAVRRTSGAVLLRTGCLGVCSPGAVVVVQPLRAGQPVGPITAAAVWLAPLTRDEQVAAVCSWLSAGGPERAPLPGRLRSLHVVPVRVLPPSPN